MSKERCFVSTFKRLREGRDLYQEKPEKIGSLDRLSRIIDIPRLGTERLRYRAAYL
jgi:hypothetical protein